MHGLVQCDKVFVATSSDKAVSPICADLLGSGGPAPMLALQN